MSKILIVISSGQEAKDKAMTGLAFARNARKKNLFEDVRLIFFGPSEGLLASGDSDMLAVYKDLISMNVIVTACVGVAQARNIESNLKEIGLELEPVGQTISGLIGQGYVPMVF